MNIPVFQNAAGEKKATFVPPRATLPERLNHSLHLAPWDSNDDSHDGLAGEGVTPSGLSE